ncbi:hypothetical protein ACFX10_032209 [Malus domestica]
MQKKQVEKNADCAFKSTQQNESDLKPGNSYIPCSEFQTQFKRSCGKSTIGRRQKILQPSSRISCGKSTVGGIQKILQPSSRSKLWKVNKHNKICADSSTTKAKDHLPRKASGGPIPTFKNKPRLPLKKFQTKVQEQASRALEEISSLIQDQASMALGSTSTLKDFKTHLLHVTSTCIQCALKWGHL